ncbi:MAG: DHH family phosphoesterase [Nodosilinea sp. LVE1205-7]|jgi:single-stranded DNA-specific DHH superfamily exonuclease
MAGVGVAYVLAICLAQALNQTQDLTGPLLELFTLGTIADLAPLTGVNRRWVRRGLSLLPRSRILGVQALIEVAGLADQNKPLKPEHIGFRLGPRINAVGRLSDPEIVIDLLTTDDVGRALERAMQCEQINTRRQELCQQIEQEAIAWCEKQQRQGTIDLAQERLLLVVQPHWHHGVIGIVASRLVERYGVPVFIGTYEDEEQKVVPGSARGFQNLMCLGPWKPVGICWKSSADIGRLEDFPSPPSICARSSLAWLTMPVSNSPPIC